MSSPTEFVQSHINEALSYLCTSLPAVVTKVQVKEQATVINAAPMINRMSQEGYVDKEPVIEDIPVQWPSGGGFRFTCPIEEGDTVMLHFTMRGAMEYKNSDGKTPVASASKRLHSMPDAFAVPTKLTYQNNEEVDPDALSVGSKDMEIRITKEGGIELGRGAAEALIKGDAFITKFLEHKHDYIDSIGIAAVPTSSLTTGVSTAPSTPDTKDAWASTLSKKVKTL